MEPARQQVDIAPTSPDQDDPETPYSTPQRQAAEFDDLNSGRDHVSPHPHLPAKSPEPRPKSVRRPIPDLAKLVGMDRGGLQELLGQPTLQRSEPPSEVWQYSAAHCVLHVFLYSDAANGRYLVAHVDAVPRRRQDSSQASRALGAPFLQDCFGRVLRRTTAKNQAQ
ncbi:MAG: hypothetical protein H8E30_00655 [Alphaproteobacteria bacterium]|nr:hypothetical protein [Alphaproteobacteria bacterium]